MYSENKLGLINNANNEDDDNSGLIHPKKNTTITQQIFPKQTTGTNNLPKDNQLHRHIF